jgi:hypothetical protein
VFITGPPIMAARRGAGATLTLPLRLVSVLGRVFPARPDTARPTSVTQTARDLASDVVDACGSADLIVLSHVAMDMAPWHSTTGALIDLFPRAPVAFTVCDQGRAGPFSALRVAGAYAASTPLRRVLMVLLVRQAVPRATDDRTCLPANMDLPANDAVVAVTLERVPAEKSGILLQQHARIGNDGLGESIRGCLPALITPDQPVWAIAGNGCVLDHMDTVGVSPLAVPRGLLRADQWTQLSGVSTATTLNNPPGWVVLVEYEPRLSHLSLAAINLADADLHLPVRRRIPAYPRHAKPADDRQSGV